jgi:transcription-repair coupling factor (superfamily II helicase)
MTARSASTCSTSRSSRCASSPPSRSAPSGEVQEIEIAPAAELAAEHRELAEIAALEEDRPDVAELLPVDRFHAFLELAPADATVLIAAEEEVGPALADHWQDVCAAFHDADAHHLYVRPEAITAALDARAQARLSSISADQPLEFRAQAADFAARSLREAEPELEKLVRSEYRTVVTWTRRGDGERAAYNLARLRASWDGGEGLQFRQASLRDGFVAAGLRLAVIPDHRLFRRRRAERPQRPARRRGALRSFADLRTGDIVVHEDHGLARFAGFDTKTVAGVTRDYLELEYAGTDRVFLPVDQLAKITRYVGAGGAHPPLSKLGGKAWEAIKARARRAAQELAGELLNLYAERRRRTGHAFPEDSEWLRQFEAAFPYQETPDQSDAIEQVKADMERPQPMDRLICGDVGYGKTEVALRAAFKAAEDGRQVLLLAPTTILAQQHFGTFAERLADFPFTVDHVSRFRSPKEQRETVAAFNDGRVDILIGTHRLLSRDLRGRDLGLIIVDEEQRFGVRQKELLRQLRLKVDVIAMSATPIPRTLQMSLAGMRDISVIETPPEGRRPVKTYVGEYDEQLVKQAIERERARGGQAFFVHNRVETIDETAERLRGLCPGVRFEVVHGQLDERALESRMLSFLRGDADVLVATSIIEAGLDIPQANTLVVERGDVFGLAQLYQIRGRVGRSAERAYAYLLYPSAAALTEDATKRLSALSDYTELGAGFKIAMRDLEIRGAGNLLGDEQSGHVAALGFELYLAMLDEAVAAAEGVARRRRARARASRCQRRRLRPGRLRPLRAGQGRRPPADRRGARGRRPRGPARRARGPLRPGARAARQPHRPATGPDQARPRRRTGGVAARRDARRDPARPRPRAGDSAARALARGALRAGTQPGHRAPAARARGALPRRRRRGRCAARRHRRRGRRARSRVGPAIGVARRRLDIQPLP